jgi:4-hydroxy-4-methyl-2-oxoglutarate aldolase
MVDGSVAPSRTSQSQVLTDAQLAFLAGVDSPTIANAIERFQIRSRTEGFIGGSVQSAFPELGTMVGRALTVTMDNPSIRTASQDGYWEMWETLTFLPSSPGRS